MGIVAGLIFHGAEVLFVFASCNAAEGGKGSLKSPHLPGIDKERRGGYIPFKMEKGKGILPEKGDFSGRKAAAVEHFPGEIENESILCLFIGFEGSAVQQHLQGREKGEERTFQENGDFRLFAPYYMGRSGQGAHHPFPRLPASEVQGCRRQQKHEEEQEGIILVVHHHEEKGDEKKEYIVKAAHLCLLQ